MTSYSLWWYGESREIMQAKLVKVKSKNEKFLFFFIKHGKQNRKVG
jgi:hypothetical protein